MKNIFLLSIYLGISLLSSGQTIGDTITVNTFNYNSTTRDTTINFPSDTSIQYEKVLMYYNMRCKKGLVSTSSQRNLGCGEWDYSCNTYVHDSSRIDSVLTQRPKYTVSGITPTPGVTYKFTRKPVYDFYRYFQKSTAITSTTSETKDTITNGIDTVKNIFDNTNHSGKYFALYSASELTAGGFSSGTINGIELEAINGGDIKYLKIRIKEDASSQLNPKNPVLNGFTEVFFQNYTFVTGANRIQFHSPFTWNGTSNLIFEFTFTNSTPGTNNVKLKGINTSNKAIFANNNYHTNFGTINKYTVESPTLKTIQNEITISFWAYGNTNAYNNNNSIIEGENARKSREVNIHLPWGKIVYFDCGTGGNTSFDRINKMTTAAVLNEKWNHWSFTKNATTGNMKIYLNGALWHSGSGKTKGIDFSKLTIGFGKNKNNPFYGKIDELRLWKKELSQTEINDWMNVELNSTHPKHSDLVAYYKVDKSTQNKLVDFSSNSLNGNADGIDSSRLYVRGINLDKFFYESANRPNLTLIQGTYTLTNTSISVLDSVPKQTLTLEEFSLVPHPGSVLSDGYNSIVKELTFNADELSYVYDAVTDTVISSSSIIATDSIVFTNLDYISRNPSKLEIMSFVTPYGIGLNLGQNGKTWVFDVTEFTPILKGNKRITMEKGGQWQEEMDIQFKFIVGKPERNVIDMRELWKVDSRTYTDIISNKYFPARNIKLDSAGKYFEVNTSITGHGQQGEFIPRTHFFKVGTTKQFNWQVWKSCDKNPVYPQGGTWIYDRAGWCPGMATNVKKNDITSFVTPGTTVALDYGLTIASGDSRYIVSNKLVTYGDYNHSLDANLVEIISPSNRVEYDRENVICNAPKIRIRNSGSTTLTSLKIEYWINNSSYKMTFNWSGNLASSNEEIIELPSSSQLWNGALSSNNEFHAELSNPNGATDEYSYNNSYTSPFNIPKVLPSNFVILYRSNNAAHETSYKLYDVNGNVIRSNSGQANNTLSKDTLNLGLGCYRFVITDTDGDGIGFWANSDGTGSLNFKNIGGPNIFSINPDFGGEYTFDFTVDFPLSITEKSELAKVLVYPNPNSGKFIIEGENLNNYSIKIINNLGQTVDADLTVNTNSVVVKTTNISSGIYTVLIQGREASTAKKIWIK